MTEVVTGKKSSPVLIAAAWAIVVLPTFWGLNYTVQNAMKIFARTAAPPQRPRQLPQSNSLQQ